MKYSEDQVNDLILCYEEDPTRETVDMLAMRYDVSPRSIIGKLSKLGIYKSSRYQPKYGVQVTSKAEMVTHLEHALDVSLDGLSNAQKPALLRLVKRLSELGVVPELENDS